MFEECPMGSGSYLDTYLRSTYFLYFKQHIRTECSPSIPSIICHEPGTSSQRSVQNGCIFPIFAN